MMDGLALGETTPRPLIMVVTFVGFVLGGVTQVSGAEAQFGSAFAGFVFIFASGPFIETTHGKLAFMVPLRAITAAVVGVIFNLALFFAYHVLWPRSGRKYGCVLPLATKKQSCLSLCVRLLDIFQIRDVVIQRQ